MEIAQDDIMTKHSPTAPTSTPPAPSLAPISRRLPDAMRLFHRQERAATMTEFIICLPLFVIIFSGFSGLWRLARTSVNSKIVAHAKLLDRVHEEEDNPLRMSPRSGLFDAGGDITAGTYDSFNQGTLLDVFETTDDLATGSLGHWGESYGRARMYGVLGGALGTGTGDNALQEMKNIGSPHPEENGQWMAFNPNRMFWNAHLAHAGMNDTIIPNWNGDAGLAANLAQVILNNVLGGPLGLLAGARYGAIDQDDEEILAASSRSTQVWGRTFSFQSGYGSLLAPQPVEAPFEIPQDLQVVADVVQLRADPEQFQWLYFYANAQFNHNYREVYDLYQIEIDNTVEFGTQPYPAEERPPYDYVDYEYEP